MISTGKQKVRQNSPFAEPDVIVEEGALEIDEGVVQRSLTLFPLIVPHFDAAEREGVDFVRISLEHLGGEVTAGTEPVFDADDEGEDTFVDVVGSEQRDEGAESEMFKSTDALKLSDLLSETLSEGVVSSSELPLCLSSFLIFVRFLRRMNIAVIHIFQKLFYSALSNMKMAPWGIMFWYSFLPRSRLLALAMLLLTFRVDLEATLRCGVQHPAMGYPAL